jgi:hypothetical protein
MLQIRLDLTFVSNIKRLLIISQLITYEPNHLLAFTVSTPRHLSIFGHNYYIFHNLLH